MFIFVEKSVKMNTSTTLKPPLTLGLTGIIGSGKSTVAEGFTAIGVPCYNSDMMAKLLMRDTLSGELSKLLGTNILNKAGELDTKLIARMIFSDGELLKSVNSLVHTSVLSDFINWRSEQTESTYCIIESAILYGSVIEQCIDKVVAVIAPDTICIERAMLRDNSTREEVQNRMNKQLSSEELQKRADFVVDTTKLIMPQLININSHLQR